MYNTGLIKKALALSLCSLIFCGLPAQSGFCEVVDKILVIVNDEIITQFAIIDAAKKAAQTHRAVELDIPHSI